MAAPAGALEPAVPEATEWRCLEAVLCPDLLEELLAEELRSSNEDSFDLFGDGGAEAEAALAEARLETLAGRLCVSDLPSRYRSPAWFLVKEVAGMAIPLVLGCSKQGHGDVIWASAEFAAAALINGELKELPKWPCRVLEARRSFQAGVLLRQYRFRVRRVHA
ncbi:unnamed protein product [Effrenium voratum]|nr:unnamed protein product [Effrenium voratum]